MNSSFSTLVGTDAHTRSITCSAMIAEVGEILARKLSNSPKAGNVNDMSTMVPMMGKAGLKRRARRGGGRQGLNASASIAACTLDGDGFILSRQALTRGQIRKVMADARRPLADQGAASLQKTSR